MSRRHFFLLLAGLILLLTVAGCGSSGPKQLTVTGTVKFDGKEVAEGDITFIPEDKSVGPEGGKIKDGKYTIKGRSGKNKVQIMATRTVPGKKGPMGEDLIEQYIPEKYNDQTELSVDVGEGKTEHNFDLKK
jgi:hypothetical protein